MSAVKDLQKLLVDKNNSLQQRVGERRSLEARLSELEKEISELNSSVTSTEKAVWLLQQYADFQQKEIIEKVESIVTSGLQAVFRNSTLEFKLYYSETKSGSKKKSPEITMAVFYEYGGNMVKGDLKNSFGGGLSVVVSTLLRIVFVMFLPDKIRPILFLDEPLRDLSPSYDAGNDSDGYRLRMAEFLQKLSEDTGIQIILVTHEPEYATLSGIDHRFTGSIGKSPKVHTKVNSEIDGGI